MNSRPVALFLIQTTLQVEAASFVFDSFTEGPFSFSLGGSTGGAAFVDGPIGEVRSVDFTTRGLSAGTTITSTLETTAGGYLTLDVDGSNVFGNPIHLNMRYSQGGPYNLLNSNAFEFDFSEISGAGSIIIELGPGSHTSPTNRVAIGNPGTISVPFSDLNFAPGASIASFGNIDFFFEADTEQFSFTLDEIRVVPEPSSILLFGIGGVLISSRRMRAALKTQELS